MVLYLSYSEFANIISDATKRKISLEFESQNSVEVASRISIASWEKQICIGVKIIAIRDFLLEIEYSLSKFLGYLVQKALPAIISRNDEIARIIHPFPNRRMVINLSAIPRMKAMLEGISPSGIYFTPDFIIIEGILRRMTETDH